MCFMIGLSFAGLLLVAVVSLPHEVSIHLVIFSPLVSFQPFIAPLLHLQRRLRRQM